MREITPAFAKWLMVNSNTKILITDKEGQGGACHNYYLCRSIEPEYTVAGEFGFVQFQNGPIKEFGINGCLMEDLLVILIDRLQSFQAGPFNCHENALALTKIQEALYWLNCRTAERINRGVEGTNVK